MRLSARWLLTGTLLVLACTEEAPDPAVGCQKAACCSNGQTDEAETDVDCGGPDCRGCAETRACRASADCLGGLVCTEGTCRGDGTGCPVDHVREDGACIHQKTVPCDASGLPANSVATVEQVTVVYDSVEGWSSPSACSYSCAPDHAREGGACLHEKSATCSTAAVPANSTPTVVEVRITYFDASGWSQPAACEWSCALDHAPVEGQCLHSRVVDCDESAVPLNATKIPATVGITFTTAGGWTAPAPCDWVCDEGFLPMGTDGCRDSRWPGWAVPEPWGPGRLTSDWANRIVYDLHTGLIWQIDLDGGKLNAGSAESYCANLDWHGVRYWRVPSPYEVISLADYARADSSVFETTFFPIPAGEMLWTSVRSSNLAVLYDASGQFSWENGTGSHYVRCVK